MQLEGKNVLKFEIYSKTSILFLTMDLIRFPHWKFTFNSDVVKKELKQNIRVYKGTEYVGHSLVSKSRLLQFKSYQETFLSNSGFSLLKDENYNMIQVSVLANEH